MVSKPTETRTTKKPFSKTEITQQEPMEVDPSLRSKFSITKKNIYIITKQLKRRTTIRTRKKVKRKRKKTTTAIIFELF